MNHPTPPQETILLSEHAYALSLDLVIAEAQQQLLVFDQDLSAGEFNSLNRTDLMTAFLNNSPSTKLTIILQNADYLTSQCPRLLSLLARFDYKMSIYTTNQFAKMAKDCFILADNKAYIRRFHIDQTRFKYSLNDEETTASLKLRFDELLQQTNHTVSTTTLGL